MSHYKRGGQKGHYKSKENKEDKIQENVDENNEIIKLFREFSVQLDDKHDRYERIVKLGRDITIESKRIIFLLHNRETDIEVKRDKIFAEAKTRINDLIDKQFKAIALELEGQNSYLYLRAYTAGLQEFIEALVFYQYLKDGDITEWKVINDRFLYKITDENSSEEGRDLNLLFPEMEFMMGIADFTGELMRKCINNLGAGKIDDCFKICEYVKYIFCGFLGVNTSGHREIGRKIYVLKQSLAKMELVCYNIRVRGSEIPKHMLAIVAQDNSLSNLDDQNDEGFYV